MPRFLLSSLAPKAVHPYNHYFVHMPSRLQRSNPWRLAAMLFMALLVASSAFAQERADCRAFRSAILSSSVRYCVFLPESYSSPDAKARRYPVLYLFHGLGGTAQSAALSGRVHILQ